VTTPAQVRELVETADQRWETLEAEGRTWQDRIAAREAAVAMRRERGAVMQVRALRGSSVLPQGQREQGWHLWRGGDVLVRSEYVIGRELITVVGQGPRWWRWSPTLGPTSGGGVGRPVRLMLGPPGLLLTLSELLGLMEFSNVRSVTAAMRPAFNFRATPGAVRPRDRTLLREAGPGAEEYELTIDAERGVLLGLSAFHGGNPFVQMEVTRVVYDAPVAPNLFAPESSVPEHFAPARAAQHVSLDGVMENLEFNPLVPEPSPSPVAPHVQVFEGDRRGLGPRHVVFAYVVVDEQFGRGQLRLTEAAKPLLRSAHDDWQPVAGVEVCDEKHGRVQRRRVRSEREGVYVELESSVLSLARMMEILDSLVPYDAPE